MQIVLIWMQLFVVHFIFELGCKKNTLIDNRLFWSEVKMNNYCLFKLALEEKHLRSMPQRALVLLFQGIENDISGQNRTEQ
jgi:hypothetical protein